MRLALHFDSRKVRVALLHMRPSDCKAIPLQAAIDPNFVDLWSLGSNLSRSPIVKLWSIVRVLESAELRANDAYVDVYLFTLKDQCICRC